MRDAELLSLLYSGCDLIVGVTPGQADHKNKLLFFIATPPISNELPNFLIS
jgi:hypothetical protein